MRDWFCYYLKYSSVSTILCPHLCLYLMCIKGVNSFVTVWSTKLVSQFVSYEKYIKLWFASRVQELWQDEEHKKKKRSLILFFFVHSVCQHKCKDKDEKKNYINIRILSSKPCWPPVCCAFDLKKKKMYVISLKSEEQKMVPDFMYIKKKKTKMTNRKTKVLIQLF